MTDRRRETLRLLAGHACVDNVERRAVDDTIALLRASEDPFDRSSFPAHLTGSAIVLDEARTHLLVVWHAGLGLWLQPGGHCESGDADLLQTARRETAEETGLHLDAFGNDALLVHVDVHDIPARAQEPAHRHHDLRFAFVAPRSAVEVLRDGSASGWVPIERLDGLAIDASLRRAVERALREATAHAGHRDANASN